MCISEREEAWRPEEQGERSLVQAPTVGEPTRWGWGVALTAVTYFLRPEGFFSRGRRVLEMIKT